MFAETELATTLQSTFQLRTTRFQSWHRSKNWPERIRKKIIGGATVTYWFREPISYGESAWQRQRPGDGIPKKSRPAVEFSRTCLWSGLGHARARRRLQQLRTRLVRPHSFWSGWTGSGRRDEFSQGAKKPGPGPWGFAMAATQARIGACRWMRSVCWRPVGALPLTCCARVCRLRWLRRERDVGAPLSVPGLPERAIPCLLFSSLPHFVCECVAAGSRLRPSASTLSRSQNWRLETGRSQNRHGFFDAFRRPFVWHANTIAATNPETALPPSPCGPKEASSSLQKALAKWSAIW